MFSELVYSVSHSFFLTSLGDELDEKTLFNKDLSIFKAAVDKNVNELK